MLDFGYYNMDCMQGMKEFPDNYFDLAIVDPPYGDGGVLGAERRDSANASTGTAHRLSRETVHHPRREVSLTQVGGVPKEQTHHERTPQRPASAGLVELGRRSSEKNHSVGRRAGKGILRRTFPRLTKSDYMGGNYFELPANRCFLIWRKTNVPEKFSMAMCEYAWTSFNDNAKWFEISAVGQNGRFHPTQKPVELYKWILDNYAKPGDKILDTHVGSASSLIACEDFGFQYVGFEIDADYYKLGQERLERNRAQMTIADLITDWRLP